MENSDTKKCPFCGETIRLEAIKCRYCGRRLDRKKFSLDNIRVSGYWHRVNRGKVIAGVCTGIAAQLDSPLLLTPLRAFFVISTLFAGTGILIYLVLWLLMPPPVDLKEPEKPADQNTVIKE